MRGNEFAAFTGSLKVLGKGQVIFVATYEKPNEHQISKYKAALKLIHEHTDLRYNLSVIDTGFNIKREA